MSPTRTTLILCVATLFAATSAVSAADQQPTGLDPKIMEAMKPGPEHQQVAKLAGTWDVACRFWMTPDAPPTETRGVNIFRTVFDGRFVEGEFTATLMGQPFTGRSVAGYDRGAKHYVSTWYDSMGTGINRLTGPSSDGGKTITYTGDMVCPKDGKVQVREVETHQSDDRFTIVMYQTKDGKEQKTMELAYTRRQ